MRRLELLETYVVGELRKQMSAGAAAVAAHVDEQRFFLRLGFRILRDGRELGTPQRLAATAFKMLVLHGGTLHGDLLARHLWPDQPQSTRHARLRNVLSRTRQQTGARIVRRGDSITLGDTMRCDLAEFLHESPRVMAGNGELLRRRVMELQALWVGPPLEDHRYEPWADEFRGRAFRLRTRLWEVLADPEGHAPASHRERQPLPAW